MTPRSAVITIKEALRFPITDKNVVIIGYPATGKTYLGGLLALCNPAHSLFKTDDYLSEHNGVEAMYAVLEEVTASIAQGRPTIVEGIAGYRMLRKGVQLGTYRPDIVFEMVAPFEQIERVYRTDPLRSAGKIKNIPAFCKAQETIKKQYIDLAGADLPTWVRIENTF